jgi:carbonic anhydrase
MDPGMIPSEIFAANRAFAGSFDAAEALRAPRMGLAVITCMDARLRPHLFLGLEAGDANILRNAGGRVTDDVVRSLALSTWLLGTRRILVIHHTDCALLAADDEAVRRRVREAGGDVSSIDPLAFADLDEGVRADVDRIRALPLLPAGIQVWGSVYDVGTGLLRPVG